MAAILFSRKKYIFLSTLLISFLFNFLGLGCLGVYARSIDTIELVQQRRPFRLLCVLNRQSNEPYHLQAGHCKKAVQLLLLKD
jgi:hypothetical protein